MNRTEMLERLRKGEDPLELAIEKWEDIFNNKRKRRYFSAHNCALCELYAKNNCEGCPVCLKTEKMGCIGTPYEDYDSEYQYGDRDHKTLTAIAKKELEFLKALRKKEG